MKAVLFDLDGTLLDIDLEPFLGRYFTALEKAAATLTDELPPSEMLEAIKSSTRAMMQPHTGQTNREAFSADFHTRTGVDLDARWDVFDTFYAEVFPGLGAGIGPMPGARDAIEYALSRGLGVAIATNPIFPRQAVDHRLAWAGLADLDLPVVTSYENMYACKPSPEYFQQTADMLVVEPRDCLMVGDDRYLDMPAANVGMRTFYVGGDDDAACDYRGDLGDLVSLLERLAD